MTNAIAIHTQPTVVASAAILYNAGVIHLEACISILKTKNMRRRAYAHISRGGVVIPENVPLLTTLKVRSRTCVLSGGYAYGRKQPVGTMRCRGNEAPNRGVVPVRSQRPKS